MILKLEYKIRFPFQSIFSNSPKFLLLRNIYQQIKTLTCINDGKCSLCEHNSQCIYYKISGSNFNHSEGLCVEMNEFEPNYFEKNSTVNVCFYLIGSMAKYESFVTEYLKNSEYIEGIYYQKTLNRKEIIDNEYVDGQFKISIPFDIDNIFNEIEYINNNYELDINKNIEYEIICENKITNYNKYLINGKQIRLSGFKGIIKLKQYSSILLITGIGKTMVVSGGKGIENTNIS